MVIKDKWEKDIEKDRLDRIKSINFSLNNNIEKGIIDDISYSNNDLNSIEKKGTEIKEKLKEEKITLGYKLSKIKMKMDKILVEINEVPKKEHFDKEKYDNILSVIPNVFSYDQIYSEQSNQNEIDKEGCDKKRKYNQCVDSFIRCQLEIKGITTIIDNIKENKTYTLGVGLATKLGF